MFGNTHITLLRAVLLLSAMAFAAAWVASPAFASTPYDGNWSVVITTQAGPCTPTVRYRVQISNGAMINSGSSEADVSGQVSHDGMVSVSVHASGASAVGSGRLGVDSGSGVWRGQGSSGACEGTWVAERRGSGADGSAVFMRSAYAPVSVAVIGFGILLVTALACIF